MNLVVQTTPEKPGGVLDLLLPYLGGKKYRPLYETSELYIVKNQEAAVNLLAVQAKDGARKKYLPIFIPYTMRIFRKYA